MSGLILVKSASQGFEEGCNVIILVHRRMALSVIQ